MIYDNGLKSDVTNDDELKNKLAATAQATAQGAGVASPAALAGSQQAQATGAASAGATAQQGGPAAPPADTPPVQSPTAGMTFAQMSDAGYARPAPPAPVAPAPAAGGAPDVRSSIAALLGAPSSYGSSAVQAAYNTGGQQIDDQYALDQKHLEEEMARRGLSSSTVYGGRLMDSNLAKRSAKGDLMSSLLQKQAETGAADQRSAIALGLQQQGMDAASANAEADRQLQKQAMDQSRQQWLDQFGYQKGRDTVGDTRYNAATAYSQGRDAVGDQRYAADTAYSHGRDTVGDTRYNDTTAYNKTRDMVSDQHWTDQMSNDKSNFKDQFQLALLNLFGIDPSAWGNAAGGAGTPPAAGVPGSTPPPVGNPGSNGGGPQANPAANPNINPLTGLPWAVSRQG